MSFSSIKSSIQNTQQLSMGDFKRLNLIDLPFRNKKIEKIENKEKKIHKRNKILFSGNEVW
jgi:hypothetical protein